LTRFCLTFICINETSRQYMYIISMYVLKQDLMRKESGTPPHVNCPRNACLMVRSPTSSIGYGTQHWIGLKNWRYTYLQLLSSSCIINHFVAYKDIVKQP